MQDEQNIILNQPGTTEYPAVNDNNHDVNFDTSNDSSAFSLNNDSDTDEEDGEDIFDKIDEDEKGECDHLTLYLNNYAVNEDIFSAEEMCSLKQREKEIAERKDLNYYRCKENHKKLYHDFTVEYAAFITTEMMAMLHHKYDTQKMKL